MQASKMSKEKKVTVAKKDRATKVTVKEEVVHVLVRVRSVNGKTIVAHRNMAVTKGAAVFGKIGQPLGSSFIDSLTRQIERGTRTYLFLTTREGWNGPYVTDRCILKAVYTVLDPSKRSLVPNYVLFDQDKIKTWFEISSVERMSQDEMNRIFVISSRRSIMSVIRSSAVIFRVGVEPKKEIERIKLPRRIPRHTALNSES
jgi:hypothetical protein